MIFYSILLFICGLNTLPTSGCRVAPILALSTWLSSSDAASNSFDLIDVVNAVWRLGILRFDV